MSPAGQGNNAKTSAMRLLLVWLVFVGALVSVAADSCSFTFGRDPVAAASNPLRGFVPYQLDGNTNTFPLSMEYFEIPMSEVNNGPNSYTFDTGIEPYLDDIASRKHQAVFRVWVDYPGEPWGVPQYLQNGLAYHTYNDHGNNGKSKSPDYYNNTLITAMENLIAALGASYDGDRRIGFIQVGLLGFWGEWHTYPHDTWFPNVTIQNRILNAFDAAFDITPLHVSQDMLGYDPLADIGSTDIGWHDDAFAYETIGSEDYAFWNRVVRMGFSDRWQTVVFGGELYPDLQQDIFSSDPPSDAQNFTACVTTTHATWLLNDYAWSPGYTGNTRANAENLALLLGYQFYLSKVVVTPTSMTAISVQVVLNNTGVAPFYYPLNLQVTELTSEVSTNFTGVQSTLPGSAFVNSVDLTIGMSAMSTVRLQFVLMSDHVLAPIVFATSTVDTTTGKLSLPVLDTNSCMGQTVTAATSTGFETGGEDDDSSSEASVASIYLICVLLYSLIM